MPLTHSMFQNSDTAEVHTNLSRLHSSEMEETSPGSGLSHVSASMQLHGAIDPWVEMEILQEMVNVHDDVWKFSLEHEVDTVTRLPTALHAILDSPGRPNAGLLLACLPSFPRPCFHPQVFGVFVLASPLHPSSRGHLLCPPPSCVLTRSRTDWRDEFRSTSWKKPLMSMLHRWQGRWKSRSSEHKSRRRTVQRSKSLTDQVHRCGRKLER